MALNAKICFAFSDPEKSIYCYIMLYDFMVFLYFLLDVLAMICYDQVMNSSKSPCRPL